MANIYVQTGSVIVNERFLMKMPFEINLKRWESGREASLSFFVLFFQEDEQMRTFFVVQSMKHNHSMKALENGEIQ